MNPAFPSSAESMIQEGILVPIPGASLNLVSQGCTIDAYRLQEHLPTQLKRKFKKDGQ